MDKKMFKIALVGGAAVFIWKAFVWMVLPWNMMVMNHFQNSSNAIHAIQENAPHSGMYMAQTQNGGSIFAAVNWEGMRGSNMIGSMILSLIVQVIGAYIILWLLSHAKNLNASKTIRFVTVVGFLAGFLTLVPGWIWMGFATSYVLLMLVEMTIGWFLAGFVMTKMMKR